MEKVAFRSAFWLRIVAFLFFVVTGRASVIISEWPGYLRGAAADIKLSNNHAYIGLYNAGVMVLDIKNPSAPVPVGGFGQAGGGGSGVYGVDIKDNILYCADSALGLRILSVEDPRQPLLIGEFPAQYSPIQFSLLRDVLVHSNLAYVATASGLQIIDVSNSVAPRARGSAGLLGWGQSIALSGSTVFMACSQGLEIIDATDADKPEVIGSIKTGGYYAFDVSISGNLALVADSKEGLVIVDVTTQQSPSVAGRYKPEGEALGVAVRGQTVFLLDQIYGITVIDISDPTRPVRVGGYDLPIEPHKLTLRDNLAYVACWGAGVKVLDITNPGNPALVGTGETSNFIRGLAVANKTALLAEDSDYIELISLNEPTNPVKIGVITNRASSAIHAHGNLAFVGQAQVGVNIVDISSPKSPILKSTYAGVAYATAFVLTNSLLFVCGSGLDVVDISDLGNPQLVGRYSSPQSSDVALSGSLAFIGSADGFEVIDWSNPSSLRRIASISNIYGSRISLKSLKIAGDTVLAVSSLGLLRINVADPSNPRAIPFGDLYGAEHIEVAGNRAFVSCRTGGLAIFDITAPSSPMLIERILEPNSNMPGPFRSAGEGGLLYVADTQGGLHIINVETDAPHLKSITISSTPWLEIRGRTGQTYVIEETLDIASATHWLQKSVLLTNVSQLYFDSSPTSRKFYRARTSP